MVRTHIVHLKPPADAGAAQGQAAHGSEVARLGPGPISHTVEQELPQFVGEK